MAAFVYAAFATTGGAAWCNGQAADRRCPAEPARTVHKVFAAELPPAE